MAKPTEDELKLLKIFKESCSDLDLTKEQLTQQFLLRWIRARNHNLGQAEEMLRKSTTWRKENHIEDILAWNPPGDIVSRCPLKMEGCDVDNSPILTSFLGRIDMKRIYQLGLRDEYLKFSSQVFERVLDKCRNKVTRDGYPVTQFILICDMDQFSTSTLLSKGAINMSIDYLKIFEANYPETLKKFVIVNANNVTLMMYNLVKHIMSPETAAKFQIYGTDPTKWQPELLSFIPKDQLCPRFGGGMKCLSSSCCCSADAQGFRTINVDAGKTVKYSIQVGEPQSSISYSFQVKAHDIKFWVEYEGSVLVQETKVESQSKIEEGTLLCDKPGKYEFVFSNGHSRFRSKEVLFNNAILPQ